MGQALVARVAKVSAKVRRAADAGKPVLPLLPDI